MRRTRNVMMKAQLQKGTSVQYRSSGWSLWPTVHTDDCCLFEPVLDPGLLREGDIVFCQVQPGDRYFAHKILKIEWFKAAASATPAGHTMTRCFTIGNNRGHANGWCLDHHIYGRLVEVVS